MNMKLKLRGIISPKWDIILKSIITALIVLVLIPNKGHSQGEQAPDIQIWTECVDDLGGGQLQA